MDANDNTSPPQLSEPQALAAFERGVQRAVAGYLANVKTEPLSLAQWAGEFGIGRETAAQVIPRIQGAERFGRRWRLPLSEAPPGYWAKLGLLRGS